MAIADDIRKTFSDPKPLYFAAGTADLAVQQAKKVPALIEKLQSEAPARIEAVRNTDPKDVQEKATTRAKEAQETLQAKFAEVLGTLDSDFKKLGETAQDLALRGVGVAAEYAVKAREKYEEVAEHGEQAVKVWRGEAADEIEEIAAAVEPEQATVPKPAAEPKAETASQSVAVEDESKAAPAKKATAKKAPAKKTTAKKTTPPAK
ncbi:hypothetical protein [Streptomyces boluensis]|uniref:Heparin-binding hemagglutinin n=1 Tax=Streptomyces boluensis TaxID=1775135 RepID=A0A964UTS1_9ACTN|nr:hypothetical protein [Streptomyces boluensis]NBE51510.1 hypothetical protein [Streptomyces boluensis]